MFLIKASYFHLYRDSLLLSTLLESEADNATFNSAQSSNSMEGTARSNNMGCWKPTDEDYSSEAKWNILHASVGVPHCPAKFVQIVINLYPEFASQKISTEIYHFILQPNGPNSSRRGRGLLSGSISSYCKSWSLL